MRLLLLLVSTLCATTALCGAAGAETDAPPTGTTATPRPTEWVGAPDDTPLAESSDLRVSEPESSSLAAPSALWVAEPESSPLGTPSALWVAEPESSLAARRGGLASGPNVALADVAGEVAENQVGDHSQTGGVSLSDAAVSNVRGLFLATFNTGNNSSVQAVLNVIVHLD